MARFYSTHAVYYWGHDIDTGECFSGTVEELPLRRRLEFDQTEYKYVDRDETGRVTGTGTEDFSPYRHSTQTRCAFVWAWDGVSRNRGGHRRFDCIALVSYRTGDGKDVRRMYENTTGAALIQLRII